MKLSRIGAIAYKEVLHVRRDPRTLILALGVPVGLILLFGYAISFDVDHLPLGVVDRAQSETSRAFVRELSASQELVVEVEAQSLPPVMEAMRRGDVVGVLVVPVDYGETLEATPQLLVDGTDGLIASRTIAMSDAIVAVLRAQELRDAALIRGDPLAQAMLSAAPSTQLSLVSEFNPAGLSAWFIVPGLAAYVVAIVAVLLTALTVAGEIERGSMEQLFATPVSRSEIVLGKLLPYLGLGATAVVLVLGVGVFVFDVPMRGNPAVLIVGALLFLAGMLGQGLLISTVARSQMVATQVAVMSSMLPSMLLSGFVFPIENMPPPLQVVSHIVPARYFVAILRGMLLRGNGFEVLWPQLIPLGIFAGVVLSLAIVRFRREAS